jgi:hypothetical protein
MIRTTVLTLTTALALTGPAAAATRTETDSGGQVTATFTYDYKRTQFGTYDFSRLHLAIDRAGARVLDQDIGEEQCEGCLAWPASQAAKGLSSVTVRDLDGDDEPEVLVDLYSGGANCCWYSDSFRFDEARNVYVEKLLRPGLSFPYTLRDLGRDGVPEFKSVDYRFAYKYGSNADTPRPVRIFDWDHGRLVDVTIAYPKIADRDARAYWRLYRRVRKEKDVNLRGVLAAYVADAYNARRGRAAWKRVVAAYRRGELDKKIEGDTGPFGREYLKSLRRFLRKLGYLRRV